MRKYPDRAADIAQSFDHKQVECKTWLIEELKNISIKPNIFLYICGSWYGNVLVPMLRELYDRNICIKMHDLDEKTVNIAKSFFKNDKLIKADIVDGTNFLYEDFVINTSCEHMNPMFVKPNTYIVLQSNNYKEIFDHCNCVDSTQELIEQYDVKKIYYEGVKHFDKYDRFMVIAKT